MEEWRPIPSAPNYEASSEGRIRRVAPYLSTLVGRVLKLSDNGNGYLNVGLSHGGKVKRRYVHQLVTEAFKGPRPPGKVSAHLNGVRWHNYPFNLDWATPKENEAHKALHGTKLEGERWGRVVLSDDQVRLLRAHVAWGAPIKQTARVFGVPFVTAHNIVKGKSRRSAGGYL